MLSRIQPLDKHREKAIAFGPYRYKNNEEKINTMILAYSTSLSKNQDRIRVTIPEPYDRKILILTPKSISK